MKKFSVLLLALLALPCLGQNFDAQYLTRWATINNYDAWKVRTNPALEDTFFVNAGDTIYSEVMLTWPYMGAWIDVGDTSTAAADTTAIRIDLYQGARWNTTTDSTDSSKFVYVKSLEWNGGETTSASLDSLTSHGSFMAPITSSPIYPARYFRYRIIGLTTHKVLGGENVVLRTMAWGDK